MFSVLIEWLAVVLVIFGAFCALWMATDQERAPRRQSFDAEYELGIEWENRMREAG